MMVNVTGKEDKSKMMKVVRTWITADSSGSKFGACDLSESHLGLYGKTIIKSFFT